jgi:hypothetical protein
MQVLAPALGFWIWVILGALVSFILYLIWKKVKTK